MSDLKTKNEDLNHAEQKIKSDEELKGGKVVIFDWGCFGCLEKHENPDRKTTSLKRIKIDSPEE